jgi:hypothetical protein
MKFRTRLILSLFFIVISQTVLSADDAGLKPYSQNNYYWQYKGKPVVLLGGSKDDSLFQIPNLENHLEEIKNAGGNYIRNTMSDRPDHDFEIYPFKKMENGKYDLNQWNEEYWNRFHNLLKWTFDRDIIVQIEVWDRFDYCDHRSKRWAFHPYNPKNNINYTSANSSLKQLYKRHPGTNENPFFFTVPALKNNETVLKYQQTKIDKMLSYSLNFPNVLYCMDNETSGSPEWGKYWSEYIKNKAKEKNVTVQTTEMWDSWGLNHPQHNATFNHPETYSFVDISQNNHQKGQKHWDNAQQQRKRIAKNKRPLNNVKIYGSNTSSFGNQRDALERFWRNIIGGAASSRFHRPTHGLGLSSVSQSHLKSARLLLKELDIFRCTPDSQSKLLKNRKPDEAYLTYIQGEQYALFFPEKGSVDLDLKSVSGTFKLKWLNINKSEWLPEKQISGGKTIQLKPPQDGYWVVFLNKSP